MRMKFGALTRMGDLPWEINPLSSFSLLGEKDPPTTSGPQTHQPKEHLSNFKCDLLGLAAEDWHCPIALEAPWTIMDAELRVTLTVEDTERSLGSHMFQA